MFLLEWWWLCLEEEVEERELDWLRISLAGEMVLLLVVVLVLVVLALAPPVPRPSPC